MLGKAKIVSFNFSKLQSFEKPLEVDTYSRKVKKLFILFLLFI
jgi:hypothetical protein